MAIHPDHPGIEVTVCINGKAMKEYDADVDDITHEDQKVIDHWRQCTATKYICPITGENFTIELLLKKPFNFDSDALSLTCYVDGQLIDTPLFFKEGSRVIRGSVESHEGSHTEIRQLVFAEIKKTDENLGETLINAQKAAMAFVGEIEVKVYRKTAAKLLERKFNGIKIKGREYNEDVSWKAFVKDGKALDVKSHGVVLGQEIKVPAPQYFETTYKDGKDYPLAVYKFKYRSLKSLEALHILPGSGSYSTEHIATPSPAPAISTSSEANKGDGDIKLELPTQVDSAPQSNPAALSGNINPGVLTGEENQTLQLLLKKLANGAQVSNLPSQAPPGNPSTPPQQSIKRERTEGETGKSARKKNKLYKETVTIDLTENWENAEVLD